MQYGELSALVIAWAEQEVWRPVKDYEGYYEISNFGKLMSLNYKGNGYKKILKTNINEFGYERIRLNVEKVGKNKKIHRLVAEAFIDNPENKRCVNHKDGNKRNNNLTNLEWCTHSENKLHAFKNNITKALCGENSYNSKLNNKYVIEIYKSVKSHRQLATEYGVAKNAITSIKAKKTWREITENL